MTAKFNETNRMVVEFASLVGNEDHYPLSRESQVWLVCESEGLETAPVWKAVTSINWEYSHYCGICSRQVIESEFKERLVQGKTLKAEDYIAEWRKAVQTPVAFASLSNHGLTLVGTLGHATAGLIGERKTYQSSLIRELLESKFLTGQTDTLTTFSIPLIDLDSCKLYYKAAGLWFDPKKYEVESANAISVEQHAKVSVVAASNTSFDLFSLPGVAA